MTQQFGGLEAYRQFIVFIAVPNGKKTDKYPIDPRTGRKADAHDPSIWLSCAEAQAVVAGGTGQGVGFVFTAQDPFFFFDLDGALDTATGEWSELAKQMCGYFQGCYVEVSLSGTGLHIIGSAVLPGHSCRNKQYGLELYHERRFCALTGTSAIGSAAYVAQPQAEWLSANYFPPRPEVEDAEWTDGPCPEWSGPTDDEELLARILGARGSVAAVFGVRASVQELWAGDTDALSQFFPPTNPADPFNRSDADAALCQHLAFWTGKDCERMDRLFRRSALYRDKWERSDYRTSTVTLATGRCTTVYGAARTVAGAEPPKPVQPAPVLGAPAHTVHTAPQAPTAPTIDAPPPLTGEYRDGYQYLGVTQQQDHFAGCVYVRDKHHVYVPDGSMLKPDQFKTTYGGYVFAMDLAGEKTTRNAWEAFTESQAFHFPKAHEVCFRPECPPGTLIQEEGFTLVNTYVPIATRREVGDPAPFLDLVARLLPYERDRAILLNYMAAMVQFPGAKFQWWPVIQGVEGNGKSAIIRVLNHCIGNRYTHLPSPEAMAKTGNQFNGWIAGKLFIGIEEIYVPHRRDFLEAFKTTVTNDRLQIEGKGSNQAMGDNRANGVMCTNHRDGVPVTIDNRRYAIFYTAQQHKEDKARDGMVGSYFPELYQWFRGEGPWASYGRNYGYAVVNHYLHTFAVVAEFNPAPHGMCQEAPATSSTVEAIRESRGAVEQEIMEAVEEGRPGFAGGWISSKALDVMLQYKSIPQNKRRGIMLTLGYDWHPALRDGRVANPIPDPAGHGRPKLYLKAGHLALNTQAPGEIARMYLEAQTGAGMAVTAGIFGGQGVGA